MKKSVTKLFEEFETTNYSFDDSSVYGWNRFKRELKELLREHYIKKTKVKDILKKFEKEHKHIPTVNIGLKYSIHVGDSSWEKLKKEFDNE